MDDPSPPRCPRLLARRSRGSPHYDTFTPMQTYALGADTTSPDTPMSQSTNKKRTESVRGFGPNNIHTEATGGT
jgi:hypothetical protein